MISTGSPFKGYELTRLQDFLRKMDLDYDAGIQYSVCILDDDMEIIATASLEENVLKCIAVSDDHQGEGLTATLISHLTEYAFDQNRTHLFLYTKPKNLQMFEGLNFYPILQTDSVLFMENKKTGFGDYLSGLKSETPQDALRLEQKIGAVVVNCNPFTLGHQYLLEKALESCDYLHVFVVSDSRSAVPAEDRFQLVQQGTADLEGVILHRASDYIISAATFPTYFIKDKALANSANAELDVELFGKLIAPSLGISCRFLGTEPNCAVTSDYNRILGKILPKYHINLEVLERKNSESTPISASLVRKLWQESNWSELEKLVPATTLNYLKSKQIITGG